MFGIELGHQARRLRDEVETLYGREVSEVRPLVTGSHQEVESGMTPNGTPYIKLNANVAPSEELIAHELFHLKLSATGFPYVFTASRLPQDKAQNIHFFVAEIYDTVEHTIFYPQMRAMSLWPDERHKRDVRLAITHAYCYGTKPRWAVQALYLTQAALLIDDAELLTDFIHYYESNNWNDALNISRTLVEMVRTDRPTTPEAAVTTLVGCLNVMNLGGTFRFGGTETRVCGSGRVRIAYLEYMPSVG